MIKGKRKKALRTYLLSLTYLLFVDLLRLKQSLLCIYWHLIVLRTELNQNNDSVQ